MRFLNLYIGTKAKSGRIFSLLKLTKNGWKTNLEVSDELSLTPLTLELLRKVFTEFVHHHLFAETSTYLYLFETKEKIYVSGVPSNLSHIGSLRVKEADTDTLPHIRGIERKSPNKVLCYNKATNAICFGGLATPEQPASVELNLSWAFYLASKSYFIPDTAFTKDSLLQSFEIAPHETE